MPDQAKDDNLPDPLANLQKIFEAILGILYQFFTKIVPIIGIGFLAVLLILYLFFELLGF